MHFAGLDFREGPATQRRKEVPEADEPLELAWLASAKPDYYYSRCFLHGLECCGRLNRRIERKRNYVLIYALVSALAH
jgi:hypothetical protein